MFGLELAKEFDTLCKGVFNTDDGKRLLAILRLQYVDSSSLKETPELTYYELGRKEFIQSLINQVHDYRDIEEIVTTIEANYE